MRDKSQPANYHPVLSLGLATSITLGILSTLPNKAIAFSFTGPFAPSNWTLTNTNADGSVDTTNAATGTIVLAGGNNGSYFTLDTPGFDSAGYLLNGTYTPLATQDGDFSAAPVSLNVNIGDVFGFRAATDTNSDGPPVFTVFAVPTVPEPSSIVGLLAVVGLGARYLRKQ